MVVHPCTTKEGLINQTFLITRFTQMYCVQLPEDKSGLSLLQLPDNPPTGCLFGRTENPRRLLSRTSRSITDMKVESIKGISFEQQGQHYLVLCGAESGVVRVYHEETGHVEELDFLTVVELLAA